MTVCDNVNVLNYANDPVVVSFIDAAFVPAKILFNCVIIYHI